MQSVWPGDGLTKVSIRTLSLMLCECFCWSSHSVQFRSSRSVEASQSGEGEEREREKKTSLPSPASFFYPNANKKNFLWFVNWKTWQVFHLVKERLGKFSKLLEQIHLPSRSCSSPWGSTFDPPRAFFWVLFSLNRRWLRRETVYVVHRTIPRKKASPLTHTPDTLAGLFKAGLT